MKYININTEEIIDLSEPVYGEFWNNFFGCLVLSNDKILFFHSENGAVDFEDLTVNYRLLNLM